MRLLLDTNVLLAATGSSNGASREVIRLACANSWHLIVTPYIIAEVRKNLSKMPEPSSALAEWVRIEPLFLLMPDVLTLEVISIYPIAKDRPVLFGALAWADVLLTLDHADFVCRVGHTFYDLAILTPGQFLCRERDAGRLAYA
jgi:predicted nucleic acid-binding protein